MNLLRETTQWPGVWAYNSQVIDPLEVQQGFRERVLLVCQFETYCTSQFSRAFVHQHHCEMYRAFATQRGLRVLCVRPPEDCQLKEIPGYPMHLEMWRVEMLIAAPLEVFTGKVKGYFNRSRQQLKTKATRLCRYVMGGFTRPGARRRYTD